MELFQEWFMSALLALVCACVFAKLFSVALYDDADKAATAANGKVKVVEKLVNLDSKGLIVKGTRSQKRVKFSDHVLFKHVDHHSFKVEEEYGDDDVQIKRVLIDYGADDVCHEAYESGDILFDPMEAAVIAEENSEQNEIFSRVDHVGDGQGFNGDYICGKGSEVDGISDESMEGLISGEKSEKDEIFQVDEEVGKMILRCDQVVGLYSGEVEVLTSMELLKEEVSGRKNEDSKMDESVSMLKENVVIRGLDNLIVEEEMKHSGGLVDDSRSENEEVSAENCVGLERDDIAMAQKEENFGSKGDEKEGTVTQEVVPVDDNDDDWEGIERTELERRFAEAVNYVECGGKGKDDQSVYLGSDVQLQLYGLHKIALEGPCHEPQPMALNFSARAKWNAWQKLGSMSRVVAMEDYIKLLSENVPSWVQYEDGKQGSSECGILDGPGSDRSFQHIHPHITAEREVEQNYVTNGDNSTMEMKTL